MEFDEAEVAVEIFRERRAVLHPVATVQIKQSADLPDLGAVDVPADHARHPALARELDHRVLVVGDVFHRRLGFQLDVGGEGPVAEPEAAPRAIDPHVQVQDAVVKHRADAVEQPVEMREAVKLVAMDDEEFFAVGRRVHGAFDEPHRAEAQAQEFFQELVMVPGDERDAGLLAVLAKQFLDEQVVVIGPIPFAPQLPAVDEVADDVKVLAFRVAQEIEQLADLRMFGSEMDVGNPDRAVMFRLMVV